MRRRRFHLRLFVPDEYKPLRLVPRAMWAVLALAAAAQIAFHYRLPEPQLSEYDLHLRRPPPDSVLRVFALGDRPALARVLMLNLQTFDNQQGASISFADLDYDILGLWLDRITALDEKSEYPHFSAAKIYTSVRDDSRKRKMVEWVRRHFADAPNMRWEWMAHAGNIAQYVVKDEALALDIAHEMRELTEPGKVPGWTRQMEVFFLESATEYEAAANLLAKLLAAGEVTDPSEFALLLMRLESIICKVVKQGELTSTEKFNNIREKRFALLKEYLAKQGINEIPEEQKEIICPETPPDGEA